MHGFYCSYGGSDFLCGAELYNGQFIRLNNPLDEFLVPILSKKEFESIAQDILNSYYSYKSNYPCRINTASIAKAMGLDIKYARLSKNGNVKSKLILDKRDTTVYDKECKAVKMRIDSPTILVDESLEEDEAQNAIIHECVHAYLHNLFYELQSYYRKMVGRKMPEFNDYFYSKTQRSCLKWMETQANAIPRFIQMPEEQASDVILNFFERLPGEPDWDDYRELIDLVKWKFGVSRKGKKVILLKPKCEDRDGAKIIKSRIGLEEPCEFAEDFLEQYKGEHYDCIIVDEAQFLSESVIDSLSDLVDEHNITVICYGLRTDFQNHLFPGAKRLMELADDIEQIKTICWCGERAHFNARILNGQMVTEGEQVQLGGNESYIALCRKHYKERIISDPNT